MEDLCYVYEMEDLRYVCEKECLPYDHDYINHENVPRDPVTVPPPLTIKQFQKEWCANDYLKILYNPGKYQVSVLAHPKSMGSASGAT